MMGAEPSQAEIEAAAEVIFGGADDVWVRNPGDFQAMYRRSAERALAAALPLVEARIRAELADELEAEVTRFGRALSSNAAIRVGAVADLKENAEYVLGEMARDGSVTPLLLDLARGGLALLAENERLREAVERVRAALLEGGQTAAIRARNALTALSPETLESENR